MNKVFKSTLKRSYLIESILALHYVLEVMHLSSFEVLNLQITHVF